eukprot:Gb_32039 [translate_table: standard]
MAQFINSVKNGFTEFFQFLQERAFDIKYDLRDTAYRGFGVPKLISDVAGTAVLVSLSPFSACLTHSSAVVLFNTPVNFFNDILHMNAIDNLSASVKFNCQLGLMMPWCQGGFSQQWRTWAADSIYL